MKDLFFFNSMLTPKIITFVYWLMLLGAIVTGVMTMFSSGQDIYGRSSGSFFYGLAILVGGVISSRIWCELFIVLFKINENLKKIADKA